MEDLNIDTEYRDEETGEEIYCKTLHELILTSDLFKSWIIDNKRMVMYLVDGWVKPESEMDCGDCPLGGDPCWPFGGGIYLWPDEERMLEYIRKGIIF